MVHALGEIHRVLQPGGILVDLRPIADHWPIEVFSNTGNEVVCRLVDLPNALAADAACEVALHKAIVNGWFISEKVTNFDFLYVWDTPDELKTYLDEEWDEETELPTMDYERLKKSFKGCTGKARVGIRLNMQLGRLRNK